jgi:ADP-ribosylation factor-like protein 8
MKCWDLGGQSQYRQEWGRYTRGCDCIVFVVDAHATHLLPDAKAGTSRYLGSSIVKLCRLYHEYSELHRLLEDTELASTALLVVSNKIDLDPHATEQQLIRGGRMTGGNVGRYG